MQVRIHKFIVLQVKQKYFYSYLYMYVFQWLIFLMKNS